MAACKRRSYSPPIDARLKRREIASPLVEAYIATIDLLEVAPCDAVVRYRLLSSLLDVLVCLRRNSGQIDKETLMLITLDRYLSDLPAVN